MKTKASCGFSLILALVTLIGAQGCKPAPKLRAVKATQTKVETTITTVSSGTVDAKQQAVLGFGIPARVASVKVRMGDRVRRGQVLAELDNSDLHKILRDAQSEAARAEKLAKEGLAAQSVLDDSLRALEVARASLDKSILKAPFDGLIAEVNLTVGEISQGAGGAKAPVRLVDLEPRVVKGSIDESDLGKIKVGNSARIKILAVRAKPYAGVVERVVPFVSTSREQDRSSAIELKLLDAGAEIPVGASADIEVVIGAVDRALALPSRTILGTSSGKYVFVVENGRLKKTMIQVGLGNYDRTEIKSGVAEGTAVVYPTDDVELQDGLKVNAEVVAWP